MVDTGKRDGENATPFTSILEHLVHNVSGSVGAVFIDDLGESVDYYTASDPYELKVIGACAALLLDSIYRSKLQGIAMLGISGTRLSLWVMPIGEHYSLSLVLEKRTWVPGIEEALDLAAKQLRKEAGIH